MAKRPNRGLSEMFVMVVALVSAALGSLVCALAISMAPTVRRPMGRLRGRSVSYESQA